MLTLRSAESQDSTYLNCHETIHRVMCIVYVIATTGTGTDVYRYIGIVATSIYSIKIMNSRKKQWIGNERMAACTFEFGSEFGRCRMCVCVIKPTTHAVRSLQPPHPPRQGKKIFGCHCKNLPLYQMPRNPNRS